jgi:SAM-dependent methyltransferase
VTSGDTAGAFNAFERAGWSDEGVALTYAGGFSSITPRAAAPLLDSAKVGSGSQLLDVATGPGYVAAAASKRGALVVGVDYSPAMVAIARKSYPGIDFREGDAELLQFKDNSFDAVTNAFGLLHMGNPEQALKEAFRVLRSGGRIAFSVWATPDKAVVFGITQAAVQAHGTLAVPLPEGPSFFRFSDHGQSRDALAAAGFVDPTVVELPLIWQLQSADDLMTGLEGGTVRSRGLLQSQSSQSLAKIRDYIRDAVKPYIDASGRLKLPQPVVVAAAVKP